MPRRVAVILTVTLSPLAGWTAGTWHAHSSARHIESAAARTAQPGPFRHGITPSHAPVTVRDVPLLDEPDLPEQDLYGNDVSAAVAKYKRDAAGATYEEHSPQTAVARLKAPTS